MTDEPVPPATEPPDHRGGLADSPEPVGSDSSAALRALLASVEELRALLAPLTEQERRQVLELARSLRHRGAPQK